MRTPRNARRFVALMAAPVAAMCLWGAAAQGALAQESGQSPAERLRAELAARRAARAQEKQDATKAGDEKKEAEPVVEVDPNAHAFIQSLVKNVDNKNPRIRYAMREALVAMGHQSTLGLKEAREAQANAHVKAFIDRTLKRIKRAAKQAKRRGPNGARIFSMLSSSAHGTRDIDKIAMELNLTWDQMDKMGPVFKRYDANRKALMKEMKDAGGFSDPEAWKDLNEEMKLMREDCEPEFAKFLDKKQAKKALRYLGGGGFGGLPAMLGDLGDIGGGAVQVLQFGSGGGEGPVTGTVRIVKPNPDK